MKTIYKYTLQVDDEQTIDLPLGAQILSVKKQRNEMVVYCLVNPTETVQETYKFLVFGTGHPIDVNITEYAYLDTVLLHDETFVLHIFYKRVV